MRHYWWAFWRMNKAAAGMMIGTMSSIVVLTMVISFCSASASNVPGYVGWGCCCSLPWLLIAAPFVWQLCRLTIRDRQAALLNTVELLYDEPVAPPTQHFDGIFNPGYGPNDLP